MFRFIKNIYFIAKEITPLNRTGDNPNFILDKFLANYSIIGLWLFSVAPIQSEQYW